MRMHTHGISDGSKVGYKKISFAETGFLPAFWFRYVTMCISRLTCGRHKVHCHACFRHIIIRGQRKRRMQEG